jgi:hypothetical protein
LWKAIASVGLLIEGKDRGKEYNLNALLQKTIAFLPYRHAIPIKKIDSI